MLIVHQPYKNRNGHLPEKKKKYQLLFIFFKKENHTLYEMRKNKMTAVHQQAGCGVPRAAKAGNQPEHTTAETKDEGRTEAGKDMSGNN